MKMHARHYSIGALNRLYKTELTAWMNFALKAMLVWGLNLKNKVLNFHKHETNDNDDTEFSLTMPIWNHVSEMRSLYYGHQIKNSTLALCTPQKMMDV